MLQARGRVIAVSVSKPVDTKMSNLGDMRTIAAFY